MSRYENGLLDDGDEWWAVKTPFGEMLLVGDDSELRHLALPNAAARERQLLDPGRRGRPETVRLAEGQLGEYFDGRRQRFELPLAPRGTEFQRSVWFSLAEIGYGETASYGEIARRVGRPTAFRAVGMANGANPLALVLPCHRVIGSDGSLTGYGGGLELKKALLEHERSVLAAA